MHNQTLYGEDNFFPKRNVYNYDLNTSSSHSGVIKYVQGLFALINWYQSQGVLKFRKEKANCLNHARLHPSYS